MLTLGPAARRGRTRTVVALALASALAACSRPAAPEPAPPPEAPADRPCDPAALEARVGHGGSVARALESACELPAALRPLVRVIWPDGEPPLPVRPVTPEEWQQAWPHLQAACPSIDELAPRLCLFLPPPDPAACGPPGPDGLAERSRSLRRGCGWHELGLLDADEARGTGPAVEVLVVLLHRWLVEEAGVDATVARAVVRDLAEADGPDGVARARTLPLARGAWMSFAGVVVLVTSDTEPVTAAVRAATEAVREPTRGRLADTTRLDLPPTLPHGRAAQVLSAAVEAGARRFEVGVQERGKPHLGVQVLPLGPVPVAARGDDDAPLNLEVQLRDDGIVLLAHPAYDESLGEWLGPIPSIPRSTRRWSSTRTPPRPPTRSR